MRPRASLGAVAPWRWRAVAALLAGVALVGCAGRRPAEEAPAGPPATPTPTAVPTPLATPTPVPPALACTDASDCALTPYGHLVATPAACYCPTCPIARNAAVAAVNEESWQRLCGGAWAERAGCLAPMCPRAGALSCMDGACSSGVALTAAVRRPAEGGAVRARVGGALQE